jgi:hypothetical protein
MINLCLYPNMWKVLSSQAFGFNLRTKMVECFRILLGMKRNIHYVQKPGNPVIVLEQTKNCSSGCMLYYIWKKHLPRKIVPLRVPFLGLAGSNYACRGFGPLYGKTIPQYLEWLQECNNLSFDCRPPILLRTLAFGFTRLRYMSDDPVVTIAEVLPLRPSRTIGNVGHKHRSKATQLGKKLKS